MFFAGGGKLVTEKIFDVGVEDAHELGGERRLKLRWQRVSLRAIAGERGGLDELVVLGGNAASSRGENHAFDEEHGIIPRPDRILPDGGSEFGR